MKKIKFKDIKIEDWILLVDRKNRIEEVGNIGNYILIIKGIDKDKNKYNYNFKTKIFIRIEIDTFSKPNNNDINITNHILKDYKLFKLNKREIQKYKTKMMLKELEK